MCVSYGASHFGEAGVIAYSSTSKKSVAELPPVQRTVVVVVVFLDDERFVAIRTYLVSNT